MPNPNTLLPVSFWKSYSAYAGVQDAMIQWWYGHNAVGFFLTAGFLGMMYYFVPKQAGRPIYSYRLSIVHFWALVFTYIWAGPHHLHYTALPDWAQSLGMVMSLILLAPSWGGMINGIMTLSGAWEKLRTDPVLRFLIVSISFYGMSTFEGPMMSIKTVNALSHYTDWTIGHVHSGALGWVALTSFATLYYMIPRLWHTQLYSVRLAEVHFWVATLGIVLYVTPMWISGVTQGLMWRAVNPDGSLGVSLALCLYRADVTRLLPHDPPRSEIYQPPTPDGITLRGAAYQCPFADGDLEPDPDAVGNTIALQLYQIDRLTASLELTKDGTTIRFRF